MTILRQYNLLHSKAKLESISAKECLREHQLELTWNHMSSLEIIEVTMYSHKVKILHGAGPGPGPWAAEGIGPGQQPRAQAQNKFPLVSQEEIASCVTRGDFLLCHKKTFLLVTREESSSCHTRRISCVTRGDLISCHEKRFLLVPQGECSSCVTRICFLLSQEEISSGDTRYILQQSRAVSFWGSRSAAGSCDTATKGLGALKSLTNIEIHKMHTPKLQGSVFFSEGAEAPRAAATQPQRAWPGPEIDEHLQNINIYIYIYIYA